MNKEELIKKVLILCDDAAKEMVDKRKVVIQQQTFARQHKFEMEAAALSYKDETWSEADYILLKLREKISSLVNEKPEQQNNI